MSFDVFWTIQGYCMCGLLVLFNIWCVVGIVQSISNIYYSIKINKLKQSRLKEASEQRWEYVDYEENKSRDA